jgi:hypothetical protein
MKNPLILCIIIIFFTSALYFFIARILIHFKLVKNGVKVIFGFTGIPGYLEYYYWKSDQNVRSSGYDKLIISQIFSLLVAVASAFLLFYIKNNQVM